MTEQLRRLFSRAGWLVRTDEEAHEEVRRAREILASGEGMQKQRDLAAAILEAAVIESAFEKQEAQPAIHETNDYYQRLREIARETAKHDPPSAPATAEDVMAEAVAKLGKSRTDEIIAYATDHKQDVAGTLRAELDFVAAHPRVEAIHDKNPTRMSSRNLH